MARLDGVRSRLKRYDAALHLFAQFAFAGARFARELVIARLLGPSGMGYWSGINIYRQYGAFSDVGFTYGLNRVLALYVHRGDESRARQAMGLTIAVSMGASLLFTLGATVVFFANGGGRDRLMVLALATVLVYMLVEKAYLYRCSVLRSHQHVGEASSYTALLGILELGFAIVMTVVFGIAGLLVSAVVAIVVTLATMWAVSPSPLKPRFDFDRSVLKELGGASLLLSLFGLLGIASQNVDRIAVLSIAGAGEKLGVYSFASNLGLIVAHFTGVSMSYVTAKFYRYDMLDMESVRKRFLPVFAAVHAGTCAVAALVLLLAPAVVAYGFPAYLRSLDLVGWLILSQCCATLALVASNAFFVLNRSAAFVAIRVGTIAATAGGYVLAWRVSGTLESIAIVNVAAGLFGSLVSSIVAARTMRLELVRMLVLYLVPAAAFALLAWALAQLNGRAAALLGLAVGGLGVAFALYVVSHRGRLGSLLDEDKWSSRVQRWFGGER